MQVHLYADFIFSKHSTVYVLQLAESIDAEPEDKQTFYGSPGSVHRFRYTWAMRAEGEVLAQNPHGYQGTTVFPNYVSVKGFII